MGVVVRTYRSRLIGVLIVLIGTPALFLLINFLHFEFLPVQVLLYACLQDALVASVIAVAAVRLFAPGALDVIDSALSFGLANAAIAIYAIMGPTVIDRSLSLYIVEKVELHGGAVAESAVSAIFVEEYLPEFNVVGVRITEQLRSGTLTLDDGCLRLTARGAALAAFTRWYRAHFLPRRRMVLGEETDALRRPFEGRRLEVNATCPTPE